MQIIDREKALELGLKRYFTGRPCRRNHISERYVSNGMCCDCLYRPVGSLVRVVLEVHREDRAALEFAAGEMNRARGIVTKAPMSEDERAYWAMVRRYRAHGATTADIPRGLRSFTLPEGVDP